MQYVSVPGEPGAEVPSEGNAEQIDRISVTEGDEAKNESSVVVEGIEL